MTNVTETNQTENPQLLNTEMPDVPINTPTPDPSLKSNQPQKIYLKDYTPPVFSVNHIDLNIELFDGADKKQATVTANLDMARNTTGDLVLFGRELQLESITLNGKTLSESDYQLDQESLTIVNAPDTCQITTVINATQLSNWLPDTPLIVTGAKFSPIIITIAPVTTGGMSFSIQPTPVFITSNPTMA